jgi:hypothetical protein
MRRFGLGVVVFVASAAPCYAQHWEFGGVGGAGFLNNVSVGGPVGSATAGFGTGGSFGAFAGQNLYAHISGEVHYDYMQSDLQLKGSGTTASFTGAAHALHYDMVYHTNRENAPVQYFAVVGGGMKIFRGTGTEEAYQPLSQFGYFTKTQALKPMVTFGVGMTYRLRPHLYLRTEVRDFLTAFPTQIITPAPGVKYGSLLNDFVPMVGLVYAN